MRGRKRSEVLEVLVRSSVNKEGCGKAAEHWINGILSISLLNTLPEGNSLVLSSLVKSIPILRGQWCLLVLSRKQLLNLDVNEWQHPAFLGHKGNKA